MVPGDWNFFNTALTLCIHNENVLLNLWHFSTSLTGTFENYMIYLEQLLVNYLLLWLWRIVDFRPCLNMSQFFYIFAGRIATFLLQYHNRVKTKHSCYSTVIILKKCSNHNNCDTQTLLVRTVNFLHQHVYCWIYFQKSHQSI